MKHFFFPAVAIALLLSGCISFGGSEQQFDTYTNNDFKISFEKPTDWAQQQDPLAVVRFGKLNSTSFAVSIPADKPVDFDQAIEKLHGDFSANPGLSNLQLNNTIVSGLHAVEISFNQPAPDGPAIVKSYLVLVKDVQNNRIIALSYLTKADEPNFHEIKQHIFNSVKIT